MTAVLSGLWRFAVRVLRAQHRDQLALRAAALAYTTLFSLVPLLTVALATVARVQPERAELVVRAIATVLPFSPTRVQVTLTAFAERTAGLGWAAVVVSALVTLYAFYQIEEVINSIWGLPQRRQWQWRLASLVALLITGPLLLTALFSSLFWLQSQPWFPVIALATRPLPLLFAVAALTALYRWVPHTSVSWKAAATGAGVASGALALIHLGFRYYLDVAANLNVVYGSLAIVLFFLVSLFLFWLALLLGAEASWVVGHPRVSRGQGETGSALHLLTVLAREGTLPDRRVTSMLGTSTAFVLSRLSGEPPILARTARGWRLARTPDTVTAGEVQARLLHAGERLGDEADSKTTVAVLVKERDNGDSDEQPVIDSD